MNGRGYDLRFEPQGDGSALLSVRFRPFDGWLVGAGADVRFHLSEPFTSPANRRSLAHLRNLVGLSLPNLRVQAAFERTRIRERGRDG